MSRIRSARHQRLMDESEAALHLAAESDNVNDARIAKQVVGDTKIYGLWESRHAQSVDPVADHSNGAGQILELRILETKLVHRRALIEYIRDNRIVGDERKRVFAMFYGPRDYENAVLAEHRQYTLAMSSRMSTDHLIGLMEDPVSSRLIRQYEIIFKRYFSLSCYLLKSRNDIYGEAVRPLFESVSQQLARVKVQIQTEKPDRRCRRIEQLAMLAKTGRLPIRDYMVG